MCLSCFVLTSVSLISEKMSASDRRSQEKPDELETDIMNEGFVIGGESSGESDVSGWPSSESSVPSSICSMELNQTMNEILAYLESEVRVFGGHEIPGQNEDIPLAPLDHFKRFLPIYLAFKPPTRLKAREIAADGKETVTEVSVPNNQVREKNDIWFCSI